MLSHPDPSRQYIINTDASGFAISGVLSQEQADGTVRPVAYWSRKMNGAETRYPVYEQELMAVVMAVKEWRCYLEGNPYPVRLLTDHQGLQWLSSKPELNSRQYRWVAELADLEFDIQYVAGKINQVADALSRRADYEQEAKAEAEAEAGRDGQMQQRLTLRLAAAEEEEADDGGGRTILLPASLLTDMRTAAQADPEYKEQLDRLNADDGLERREGLLYTSEGIAYVPHSRELQRRLLEEAHDATGPASARGGARRIRPFCYEEDPAAAAGPLLVAPHEEGRRGLLSELCGLCC